MALGDVKANHNKKAICLLDAATANNAIPSAATDGVPVFPVDSFNAADTGHGYVNRDPRESTLMVHATANTGQTLVGTLTLWGYLAASGVWYEVPLNGGTTVTPVALAETDTDRITFVQRLQNLGHFDRLYLQLTGIGGTGASFTAWLVTGVSGTAA